ncbi:MAG: energy transducer TonB, partial [Caulobacteraceae bacterium]|nr:energy transducer TonB [Caulobacteraceae bacterium]
PAPKPLPPTPKSSPTPPPPAPAPKPAPAKAAPVPKPAPKPTPASPSKSQAQTAQAAPDDDSFLNSLSKDLAHSGSPLRPKPPSRPTPGTGSAPSAAALASLSAQLQRLWNPNCDVMGGADVNLTVRFMLGPSGRVIGTPVSSVANSPDPIVKAASDRAIRAVFQAQPIAGLNPDHYTVNFNARQACGQ